MHTISLVIITLLAQFLPLCRCVFSPSVEEVMHNSVVGSRRLAAGHWEEATHGVLRAGMKETLEKKLRQY